MLKFTVRRHFPNDLPRPLFLRLSISLFVCVTICMWAWVYVYLLRSFNFLFLLCQPMSSIFIQSERPFGWKTSEKSKEKYVDSSIVNRFIFRFVFLKKKTTQIDFYIDKYLFYKKLCIECIHWVYISNIFGICFSLSHF